MRFPIIFVGLLFSCFISVWACGISDHNEIVERAVQRVDPDINPELAELLITHPEATDPGSVFPDSFWALTALWGQEFHDMGGYAHGGYGSAFGNTVMHWLHLLGEPPYSENDQLLLAFCLGSFCHSTADAVFHPNFLPAAWENDQADETIVEVGTDVFCMMEQGERFDNYSWYVPHSFMAMAVRPGGYNLNSWQVVVGMALTRVGIEVEKVASPLVFDLVVSWIPWTHENYVTYPVGGIDNMADESVSTFETAWDELINGSRPLFLKPGLEPDYMIDQSLSPYVTIGFRMIKEGIIEVPVDFAPDGVAWIGKPIIRDHERFMEVLGEETARILIEGQ